MNYYKVLGSRKFIINNFSLVPIRYEDRYDIMNWRNQQIYHLRQSKLLTIEEQNLYFENVIKKIFELESPGQILFSFLEKDVCVGYGGLVHINWIDKNAEISFIMKTELETKKFNLFWKIYLKLIEQVAFESLDFHKIYTYAFDLRPNLYKVLQASGFYEEARLKEHCYFEGRYKDVVINSKFKRNA
jgi:RimJ/RimL family protein N-acetyltransferase